MTAGIGLGRHILGHRNAAGEVRLLRREVALVARSSRSMSGGGGAKNFDATSTRDTLAMTRFGVTTSAGRHRA